VNERATDVQQKPEQPQHDEYNDEGPDEICKSSHVNVFPRQSPSESDSTAHVSGMNSAS